MSTTLNPYLNFDGNCEEAMNFYKECLNAELELMTFEDAPMEIPENQKKKIMHATLRFDSAVVMASDTLPDYEFKPGSSFAISINATDLEKAELMFNNLAKGGTVLMPYKDAFWGDKFGMLKDKYGVSWMVSCAKGDSEKPFV